MDSREPPRSYGPPPELDPRHFAARRDRLLERIGNGVAILVAAPELLKSRDTEVPYRQSSDFYYFTGLLEPESAAVLTPHDGDHRFTIFVRRRDEEKEMWSGARLGVEGALETAGADAAYPIEELGTRLPDLLKPADSIHYPLAADAQVDHLVTESLLGARKSRQRSGGPAGLVDLEASTSELRLVKDDLELQRMRIAAEIGAEGHIAAMLRARPGAGEWEIQAALEATYRSMGAAEPAFPSIVGAGANATVLHYVANRSRVHDGDLILIDSGAEWGMYCSDITRTLPASGRFAPHQLDLYEIVLAAEEEAIAAAVPGAASSAPHEAALKVLVRGMLDLGIMKGQSVEEAIESEGYKRFFPHQTSHWIGLDVHDVGPYRRAGEPIALEPGMVLTIEPGIYIPLSADDVPEHFRGVGVRIEDDVLVTPDGNEVLTRGVPVAPTEIEYLMRGE
ncbi:MAG: aminopeptidase P N-terminal domain-containing protein [Gemmatimonadota bacterium]